MNAAAFEVSTTPVRLIPLSEAAPTQFRQIIVLNEDSDTVYVGPAGVTTATGFPLIQGAALSLDNVSPYTPLWGRTASGTSTVRVLEAQ